MILTVRWVFVCLRAYKCRAGRKTTARQHFKSAIRLHLWWCQREKNSTPANKFGSTWMQCHDEFPLALYANQAWKRANLLARERTRPSYLWRCVFTFFYFIYFNECDSLQWAMKNKRAQFLDDVLLISTWLGRLFNKSWTRRNINQHLFATSLFYIYVPVSSTTLFTLWAASNSSRVGRDEGQSFCPGGHHRSTHRGCCIK